MRAAAKEDQRAEHRNSKSTTPILWGPTIVTVRFRAVEVGLLEQPLQNEGSRDGILSFHSNLLPLTTA